MSKKSLRWLMLSALALAIVTNLTLGQTVSGQQRVASNIESKPANGKTHTYYVAADEVDWDYSPGKIDQMTGKPYEGLAKAFTERGPNRIGTVYRKAVYREYTDATFAKLKARAPEWEHQGILGPILRAEVGETINVVFKNNASRPYSMHPHGVSYKKDSEGALYNDGVSLPNKKGSSVAPGETHTYVWEVPERAGPGPGDPSSVVWLYHSHVSEPKDINAGLVGAIIVSARGASKPNGMPKDVDREFVTLFMIFDENQSWYLDHNINTYCGDPKSVRKDEAIPLDPDGRYNPFIAGGFATVNFKATINGYLYGNGPMMTMKQGERVRWYLVTIGFGGNFHTPHWHGNVVLWDRKRTDVISISPAQMVVADMVADNPGMWMFHCHVDDHMEAGMHAHYQVLP